MVFEESAAKIEIVDIDTLYTYVNNKRQEVLVLFVTGQGTTALLDKIRTKIKLELIKYFRVPRIRFEVSETKFNSLSYRKAKYFHCKAEEERIQKWMEDHKDLLLNALTPYHIVVKQKLVGNVFKWVEIHPSYNTYRMRRGNEYVRGKYEDVIEFLSNTFK